MPIILTPNMSLPVPVVGQELGPQYATDINSSLSLIDGHNHTPGFGVQIPPSGLNINSDLTFINNRATNLKATQYFVQSSLLPAVSPNLGAIYVSGVDLYYNDVAGNQIRITQSGGVAGASGSITGLTAPASATYVSANSTFVWQSNTNRAAGMDNGPVTIREIATGAKGITIQSPTSLPADYSLTLPLSLPVSTQFVKMDSSGNISTADITTQDLPNPGPVYSASCGLFNTTSATLVDITNLSVTITSTGKPIVIGIMSDQTGLSNPGYIFINSISSGGSSAFFNLDRNGSNAGSWFYSMPPPDNYVYGQLPSTLVIDPVSAGTYTYKLQVEVSLFGGGHGIDISQYKLYAYELQ